MFLIHLKTGDNTCENKKWKITGPILDYDQLFSS